MSLDRREFVWTVGIGAGAAAATACRPPYLTGSTAEDPGWAPGIEARVNSTCLICPARCGIRGRTVDGRLVRILGNPLHPMSRGGVCPRGIGGVQVLYHPQRVTTPLVRTGARGSDTWKSITPPEAIQLLVERLGALRKTGHPERLGVVAGYCAGSMDALWRQFLHAFGSPNYVSDTYPDGLDAVMAVMHGIPRRPGYDLDASRLVLSFGAPLFEAWWSPVQAYAAFGRGPTRGRLVQVDTRFSRTAARAHEWVGVQPGTYGVLALGLAYVMLKEQAYNADFVARHVAGFDEYRDRVLRNFRTEEVSALTGVPVERIVALARGFAGGAGAVAVCGPDVLHSRDGLLAGLAVHSLNVLAGNIGQPGGVVFGDEPPLASLAAPLLDAAARAGFERPAIAAPAAPFGTGDAPTRLASAIAAGKGSLDVLLLYYANPLASSGHPDTWRAALERIPFVATFSPFLDDTTRFADLVIPDLLPYERWQDAPTPSSYPYPVWGLAQPLVDPPPRAVHTADALLAVAKGLGGGVARSLPYPDFQMLLKERARGLFAVRRGMTFGDEFERTHVRQMEERGWWLAQETSFDAFWKDLVERGGWADLLFDGSDPARIARTASGRIELLPEALGRATAGLGAGHEPYTAPAAAPPAAPPYPQRLMPYRVSTLASGTIGLEPWLAEQPALFPDVHWIPWVEVHPTTASQLGLADATMVWVTAARGRYRARLRVFPGTPAGHVVAPYGLRHPGPGGELANPFQVLDGATDPLTGLEAWDGTFVRLERA